MHILLYHIEKPIFDNYLDHPYEFIAGTLKKGLV